MSDQNVTIQPGMIATLSVSMSDGATIQNQDSNSAVWLSASPGVAPGVGVRLGPNGSVQWTTAGSPCYAVTDTGVTTPVSLVLSSDISMPVNPVDVASAVAARLLATGIPSVLLGEVVGSQLGGNMDVSHYASLTVKVQVLTPGRLTYQFTSDSAGWQVISSRNLVVSVAGYVTFNVPVNGPYFNISGVDMGALNNLSIYGTNRVLKESLLGVSASATIAPTRAWVSGTQQDVGMSITTNGGSHGLRMAVTGSAKGLLMASVWDETTQALGNIPIAQTGEALPSPSGIAGVVELTKVVQLPPGVVKFVFLPYTTATFQVVIGIIPPS